MSEKTLSSKIDKLIDIISNNQVAPIAPVAPVAPVLPVAPINSGDHDLLQRIDTKVDRVIVDVANINSNYSTRIEKLEREKVDKVEFEEHKKSNDEIITKLLSTKDTQTVLLSIGIGLIIILSSMLIYHLFNIKV